MDELTTAGTPADCSITCSGCGHNDKSKHTCTGKAWDGKSLQEVACDCDCEKTG